MKKILAYIVLVLFFLSCKKQKPPVGNYVGTFIGSYVDVNNDEFTVARSYDLEIIESSKESLIVNYHELALEFTSRLAKKKKEISGTLIVPDFSLKPAPSTVTHGDIVIKGNWIKEKDIYYIVGEFNSTRTYRNETTQITTTYPVTGTFIIESKFE